MIILESVIIAVVCAALLPLFTTLYSRLQRRLPSGGKQASVSNDARATLQTMLSRLQCETHPLSDNGSSSDSPLAFDYQGGHFIATFPESNEPFAGTANISFFSCFSCSLEHTSAAERTCNEINSMVLPIKCTMSTNDGSDGDPIVMSLHTSGIRLIDDEEGLMQLKNLLGGYFHVQRVISERFNAIREEDPGDIFLNRQPYVKSLYALAHAELNEQPEEWSKPWFEAPAWNVEEFIERITGTRPAYDYDLFVNSQPIADDAKKTFEPFRQMIDGDGNLLTDTLAIMLVPKSSGNADAPSATSIVLKATDIDDRLVRIRVDYSRAGMPVTPYRPVDSIEEIPEARALTVCVHRGGPDLFKAEAEYMAGEEGLVERCLKGDAAYSLYWGRALFADGRFLEAEHYLRNAFSIMRKAMEEPEKQLPETCSTFNELCYFLGVVYYQLGRYRESYYYLDIIVQQHRLRWTQQYVLTLMALGDPRVPSILKSLSEMTENAEPDETIEELQSFVKRQTIILDIRNGNTEQARAKLEKMLETERDSAFALHWLSKLI